MKRICETQFNGWDTSAERIIVYALENDDEYWMLNEMTHKDKCEYFSVVDESDHFVTPGAAYYMYEFELHCNFLVIIETMGMNV